MRVAFGWLNFQIDFKTEDEAKDYIIKHKAKNPDWWFSEPGKMSDKPDAYGNQYTVEVRRPWREYPNGFSK